MGSEKQDPERFTGPVTDERDSFYRMAITFKKGCQVTGGDGGAYSLRFNVGLCGYRSVRLDKNSVITQTVTAAARIMLRKERCTMV